jgi:chloride channel 7
MGGEENDMEIEGGMGMERGRSGASSSSSSLSVREPLLLSRRITNNTSQLAIVGANVCSIESLDYEYDHSLPQRLKTSSSLSSLLYC